MYGMSCMRLIFPIYPFSSIKRGFLMHTFMTMWLQYSARSSRDARISIVYNPFKYVIFHPKSSRMLTYMCRA